jgi:hypothetical protein
MSDELRLKQLVGADGVVDGRIQWGEEEGLDPMVVHAVTVPLAPLRLGDDAHDERPVLRLHSIRFDVQSWRELEGRSFSFPNVVREIMAEGRSYPVYDIYGSLRLGSDYHQVLMTSIAFAQYDGCTVDARLEGRVQSVTEPPRFAPTDFTCEASLTVGPVAVVGDLGSSTFPSRADAEELARKLLRLEDYGSPEDHEGGVRFAPSC